MAWAKSKYKELGACYKDYRKEYQVWTAIERHMAMGEDADSAVIGILKRKGYVLTIPERIA